MRYTLILASLCLSFQASAQLVDDFNPPRANCCLANAAQTLANQLQDWNQLGRYHADNEKLKAQLAQQDSSTGKIDEAYPKSDSLKKDGTKSAESQRKLELTLPSDQDIDRAMGFLERAWRRLVEMANRIQRDASGKI